MMEFSFGRWGSFTDQLFGNGFKSINIGDTRIDGVEGTFGITGTVGKDWTFNLSGGITYIDGRQLNYDSAYVALVGGMRPVLGSDSTDALKYRSKTTYKADVSATWKKAEIGLGMRYFSRMENIDYVFVSGLLDFAFPPGLGIGHYRKYHRYGDMILDLRTSYTFNDKFKLAFIVKNLTNYIYMQRPADTQPPRQFVLQLNVSL
jgi:outer membrane receptor protein involved in Fe transport